jgi:hypothetical protein
MTMEVHNIYIQGIAFAELHALLDACVGPRENQDEY